MVRETNRYAQQVLQSGNLKQQSRFTRSTDTNPNNPILSLAGSSKPVVVVSTDTDILVMLFTQVVLNIDLHMVCQKNPTMLGNIHDIQDNIGDTCTYLMVIHAISGCDIVSAVYHQGKHNAFNLVHKKH